MSCDCVDLVCIQLVVLCSQSSFQEKGGYTPHADYNLVSGGITCYVQRGVQDPILESAEDHNTLEVNREAVNVHLEAAAHRTWCAAATST